MDKVTDVPVEASGGGREDSTATNFVRALVEEDLKEDKRGGRVATRFPPEPNGFLHIGHAKSICLNFGIAHDYDGVCHLRFDDTNPETEDIKYVEAIKRDVRWLGFDWGKHEYYASDYFEQLYDWAVVLIKKGKAYVDSLSEEEIRAYRGTVTEPGRESPYRNRTVEENLKLFEQMRGGAYQDGEHVLRAKIDMASNNMKMRDPLMYRIRHSTHYRRGDAWCLYPFYDWAHGQSDALEDITHSICTLEFENNRELYDWYLDTLEIAPRPYQYEFARLNLDYTVMSKRKLLQLVGQGHVDGWDDPRMLTIAGLRRRGVTPRAIRAFSERIGVTKVDSRVDIGILEHSIRDDLNFRAPRVMGVLRPLKVVLTNYPEDQEEWLDASYWPHDVPKEGSRKVPFSRELYIERDDFMEDPPKRFYRLAPGREVRLRYGYFITCTDVIKDEATGEVVELRCTYDPATRGGDAPDGRRVKATLHWVSAAHAVSAEVRLYDRLFRVADPDAGPEPFMAYLNPDSIVTLPDARLEPSVLTDPPNTRYQFERQGYFWQDPVDSSPDALVFNRIISLRDSWAKISKQAPPPIRQERAPAAAAPKPKTTPPPKAEVTLSAEQERRLARYVENLGLDKDDALILVDDLALAAFYEEALAAHDDPKAVANWVIHELRRALKDTPLADLSFEGSHFGRLVALIEEGTISGRSAKEVFAEMVAHGGEPDDIVARLGLQQVTDADALKPLVDELIAAHPDKVEQYRGGKTGLMGFFVGQVMRQTRGTANPQLVQELVREQLG